MKGANCKVKYARWNSRLLTLKGNKITRITYGFSSRISPVKPIAVVFLTLAGNDDESSIPVDVSFMSQMWTPDAEIRNLKEFKTLNVLSKVR